MSGDVIEKMAKALAQTLANESGHAHPFAGGYSHHKRKVTPEHERKARKVAAAALAVVRDELADEALREAIHSAVWNSPVTEIPDAALSAVATHLGGAHE